MVEDPRSQLMIIHHVDQSFGNGDSGRKFVLHKVRNFDKVCPVDLEHGGQLGADIINFLINCLEVLL
jgi:hypothetical protein